MNELRRGDLNDETLCYNGGAVLEAIGRVA